MSRMSIFDSIESIIFSVIHFQIHTPHFWVGVGILGVGGFGLIKLKTCLPGLGYVLSNIVSNSSGLGEELPQKSGLSSDSGISSESESELSSDSNISSESESSSDSDSDSDEIPELEDTSSDRGGIAFQKQNKLISGRIIEQTHEDYKSVLTCNINHGDSSANPSHRQKSFILDYWSANDRGLKAQRSKEPLWKPYDPAVKYYEMVRDSRGRPVGIPRCPLDPSFLKNYPPRASIKQGSKSCYPGRAG
jgi:hypothetical protein